MARFDGPVMPQLDAIPDMPRDDMHAYHTGRNEFVSMYCGIVLKRGCEPIRATTQAGDVTCSACAKALRAAGIAG